MKAEQIIELRKRVQTLDVEIAKATQRRETALAEAKKAEASLKKLGFNVGDIDKELEKLYNDILKKVEIAEEILGIKR